MKRVLSVILCAALVLMTGCSSVSQDEYNSLIEENQKLNSETERLEDDLENLKADKAKAYDCIEIYAKMLSLPESAILKTIPKQHSSGLYEEDTFYSENGESFAKLVLTFDRRLSVEGIAPYIKVYVDGIDDNIGQLEQSQLDINLCIYRYDNGKVLLLQCWHREDDGTMKSSMFFTSYGKELAEELNRLYEEEKSNSAQ